MEKLNETAYDDVLNERQPSFPGDSAKTGVRRCERCGEKLPVDYGESVYICPTGHGCSAPKSAKKQNSAQEI